MAEAVFHKELDSNHPRATHIERINGGGNPAYIPGLSPSGWERPRPVEVEEVPDKRRRK